MAQSWVVCLCADWCNTCGEYRSVFDALARSHPQVRFAWVDIEDEAELVGDLDIETFPTLLLVQGERVHFLGPVLPQPEPAARLIAKMLAGGLAAPPGDAQAQIQGLAVVQRLRATMAPSA